MSGMAGAGAHLSVGEDDIQAPVDATFRRNHSEGLQIGPLLGLGQTVQLIESLAAAGSQATMILLNGFGRRVRCPRWCPVRTR